jgi:hypothetical protein
MTPMTSYWVHTPVGLPMPRFVFDYLLTDDARTRFAKWLYKFGPNPTRIAFYLAAQHQWHGTVSRELLRSWCEQVQDIPPQINLLAQDIESSYQREVACPRKWTNDATSALSELPAGRVANIAIMHATLAAKRTPRHKSTRHPSVLS